MWRVVLLIKTGSQAFFLPASLGPIRLSADQKGTLNLCEPVCDGAVPETAVRELHKGAKPNSRSDDEVTRRLLRRERKIP